MESDVLERFGWDGDEGLVFDRTKPLGESTLEKGPLYEEVTTDDLIEIANALAAEVRELRKDRERLDWVIINDVRLVWSTRVQKHFVVEPSGNIIGPGAYGKKMAIDAAMAEAKERPDGQG